MKRRILLLIAVTVASFLACTNLFMFFERGINPNVRTTLDVVYWWTVTSATVGYGDITPVTPQGKIVTILTIVSGFFIFANLVALLAEAAHSYLDRRVSGRTQVIATHHVVICEYTAVADEIIQSLPGCPGFVGREIVVVSDLVQRRPYPQHLFVNGVPINPAALNQANVSEADYVFVFANLRFADPDIKTMHIAVRVRKLNPRATLFVELVNPDHELLQYAGKDVIPLDSRAIMGDILSGRPIDPAEWIRTAQAKGASST